MAKSNPSICPECQEPLAGVGWDKEFQCCSDCADHFRTEAEYNDHLIEQSLEDNDYDY